MGCRESPEAVVRHPDYGWRTLCLSHAQRLLRKPPQGEEREARPPSASEGAEGPEPTAPERADQPEAGDPEWSPATEAEPHGGPSGADIVRRCGAAAVYILHLRESTPRSVANHRERRLEGDSR